MAQNTYTKHLEVALTDTFQRALGKLDPNDQAAVNDAVNKFYKGYAAADLHNVGEFKGLKVSRNAMRIVCQQDGDTLLLLYVGPHDKAYEWGERHSLVQHGRVLRVRRTVSEDVASNESSEAHEAPDKWKAPRPLQGFKEREWGWFDVPPGAAAVLQEIPDEDSLLDVATLLRESLAEALLSLASDPEDVQNIANRFQRDLEARKAGKAEKPSLSEAVKEPINAGVVWVPPPSENALVEALKGDLESWRVFLHPSQQRLVEMDANGPVKVTGGPGTGKSVVAVHRARHLAEQIFSEADARILLTTFSKPLSVELETMLDALCRDAPALRQRIEVKTLTQVAQQILRSASKPAQLLVGADLQAAWQEAMKADTLGYERSFYEAERTHVVVRLGAWTGSQYLRANRTGMGSRLGRRKRLAVWKVLEAFEGALARRGGGDVAALARDATRLLRRSEVDSPWMAVVCDEVQDAGASELRMLAALTAGADGSVRPNGMFLVGDGYQRLYARPVVLSRCGIEVRGRSSRLRLNYRTTEPIRRAAVGVVEGLPLDALDADDGTDSDNGSGDTGRTPQPLNGYRSLRGGPAPTNHRFESEDAEADWIAEQVNVRPERLLVLARTRRYLNELRSRLMRRGIEARILEMKDRPDPGEKVALCTMHRAKGLESPGVILAGAHKVPLRWHGSGGDVDKALWERQERCLQYVAMTRARDWLGVSAVG